jgi:hypothetical protein
MALLLVLLCAASLVAATRAVIDRKQQSTLIAVLLFAFCARLFFHVTVARSGVFFSHGQSGGDSIQYEDWGRSSRTIGGGTGLSSSQKR